MILYTCLQISIDRCRIANARDREYETSTIDIDHMRVAGAYKFGSDEERKTQRVIKNAMAPRAVRISPHVLECEYWRSINWQIAKLK